MFPGYANANGKIVGKLRTSDTAKTAVAEGWPSLLDAMDAAQINTARRVAAFLTTLGFESLCEYNIEQFNSTDLYKGRGYIQLTGKFNYETAGKYLGIDMLGTIEKARLARDLRYSAKIAIWYWTVAQPLCNTYADELRMGKVNAAIGYPLSGTNDADRCMVFGKVLHYLTGSVPAGITCTR